MTGTTDDVRAQYESYPYPARNPKASTEPSSRSVSPLENLHTIEHFLFRGERVSEPCRILIAGGGTGDACVLLGEQLNERGVEAETVYLDLSTTSTAIARERCKSHGVKNIEFHTGSLLDIDPATLGTFDYINCSGVLHHLQSPEAGLAALAGVLRPGGGMGLMVYGELGRTGIYQLQELFRTIGGDLPLEDRVPLARAFLRELPSSNWLVKNDGLRYVESMSDEELVDRFLHPCDRAYTVEGVYSFTESAGLRVVGLVPPLLYDPRLYVQSSELKELVGAYGVQQRCALAEKLFGMVARHSWFAAWHDAPSTVAPIRPDAVPEVTSCSAQSLADTAQGRGTITMQLAGTTFNLPPLPTLLDAILRCVDGKRELRAIHSDLQAREPSLSWTQFETAFRALFEVYGGGCLMTLKHPRERSS